MTEVRYSKWAALIVAVVLVIFGKTSANMYYSQVIQMAGINIILALGLNLIFGHTGQISIGQAGFYALGAYASAIMEVKLGVPFWAAWPLAITMTIGIAFVIGKPILKLHGHYLAMATIAFGMIIESLATNWIQVTSGHDGIYLPTKTLLGQTLGGNMYILIVVTTVLLYLVCHNIEYSRIGRAIRSVREDEQGAASIGIEHSKYKVIMFALGAGFSAIAGILYAHLNTVITPELFGMNTSVLILMMVVVGGIGSNIGVVIGAAFITVLPEFLYAFQDYNILVYGLMVCFTLLFLPKGIYGILLSMIGLIQKAMHKKSVA